MKVVHSDLSLSMDIKYPPSIQPSSQGHYLRLARTLSSERQKASQNEYVEQFQARFKQGDSPTTTNPYVESIHSKLTSQPVKARSPVRLRNEYVEVIDAKLSSKRKTPAAGKVKVQTSGKDKNEYVEKLHAKLSTKRPCEHHHHGKRKREWISSALKKVSQLYTHCRVLYGVCSCTVYHCPFC